MTVTAIIATETMLTIEIFVIMPSFHVKTERACPASHATFLKATKQPVERCLQANEFADNFACPSIQST
jgi:hypothetical protein